MIIYQTMQAVQFYFSHITSENLIIYIGLVVITIVITSILTYVYLTEKTRRHKKQKKFDIYHNYISLLESFDGMAYRCLNDEYWTMKYVSKRAYELTGYMESEVIDNKVTSYNDIVHPKYREILRQEWDKAIENHENFAMEYVIVTKKGEEKWVNEIGHAVYNDNGIILYIEGFIKDVSSSKQLMISERKNQTKFRNLIENSQDAIFIQEDYQITYTNPACVSFFRAKSIDDLLGKQMEDLISNQYVQFYHDRIQRIHDTHLSNPRATYEFKRFDGTMAYAEVSSSPYFDQENMSIFIFIHDITESVRKEREIHKIQKRNRDLIIEMSEGIGVFARNKKGAFSLVFQNKGFSMNLFGEYTRLHSLTFEEICKFIPKEEHLQIFSVISSGEQVQKEYQIKRRFLEVRFFTNVDRELVMMVKDVSNIQNAYQEMRNQASRLENIINGTNVGTWEWNILSGAIIANDRWFSMLGYEREELSPTTIHTWESLVHPEDLEGIHLALNEHFAKKSNYYNKEYRMIHKDGHYVWILARGSVSEWSETGEPTVMFGTAVDISLGKEREIELEYVSNHDFLTGLNNRRAFENYIVSINHKEMFPITVIMADVNQLKYINDNYGHQIGDNLLCKVSQTLSSVCRPYFVARTGGDEFMIVLTNAEEKKSKELLEEIKLQINQIHILNHSASVSFGMASSVKDHIVMNDLIREAEVKMYQEKEMLRKIREESNQKK